MNEPTLRVGLLLGARRAEIDLRGTFAIEIDGEPAGDVGTKLVAISHGDTLAVDGIGKGRSIHIRPTDLQGCTFLLHDMIVGVSFHWEHTEDLRFRGGIHLVARDGQLDVINEVPLEEYIVSVISSEMSPTCPGASLRAHAVISRSWLLAQVLAETSEGGAPAGSSEPVERDGITVLRRWYDREDHEDFDVCADDHCQRYQGITRAYSEAAEAAVRQTRGLVLMHDGEVCDARFSKCCGGMTEVFEAAWGDEPLPYLQAFVDGEEETFDLPLTDEGLATRFIEGEPAAFCNTGDRELLERILPDIDHGTQDFYRWETTLSQDELSTLVREKSGIDPGPVLQLIPRERGPSGRLIELDIVGSDRTLRVGKELEIRRLLSTSHLYSSAFVVSTIGSHEGVPASFVLRGAGWGHGVGLCQIGAAVMADRGYTHEQILTHYYRGAALENSYA
jgi:stage II sporulation protein D